MSTETDIASSPETKPPTEIPLQAPKRSAFEGIKENSRQLRGGFAEELAKDSDHFSDQDKQLLKFHGSYQQEDRDARKNRKKEGVGKHYMFMVRCKIPGGRLTAKQYLAIDDLAGAHANGTIRFTSRQGIQLHGVLKSNLKEAIAGINACLLTTLGACGDVERNVMACPAPHYHHGVHAQLQETAAVLAAHLAPRTRAYHEIWLNGEKLSAPWVTAAAGSDAATLSVAAATGLAAATDSSFREEPLYGKVYLPRKFKTGLALPEDNCIDIFAQDLGLLAIVENGTIAGYNVLAGGGMGMTHGNPNTFPHLAQPVCYVPSSAVVNAAEAVVRLFRDHGNRADRKRARIKYVIHDWGLDKFRKVLGDYIGGTLLPPRPIKVRDFDPHLGWQAQGNGKWYYGISIENGRVKDEGSMRLRSGLRAIIERFGPDLRITPLQDILLCDLEAESKPEIEKLLKKFGIQRPDQISTVQKFSMACPAIPTCGLALSESERALPSLIDKLEVELKRLGLEKEKLSVRMTGCPNGCVRPYQSDIGIVGRSGDKYTIFVGGNLVGDRLSFMLRDLVPIAEIVPLLVPLLERFKQERRPDEGFGDWCGRLGVEKVQELLPAPASPRAAVRGPDQNGGLVKRLEEARPDGQAALAAAHGAPDTRPVPLALGKLEVNQAALAIAAPFIQSETFLRGLPGEERRDHSFRYNSDGSVRETAIYYYGSDLRAESAHSEDPLRREAVYLGRVDPVRLHAVRKLSDTFYIGPSAHERRDRRIEYNADGSPAQTVVFLYEGDVRASAAPSGAPIRRQVVYQGMVQ